jgi:hypothetical protein
MAGSGDHTYIDPEVVRESGTTIGGLMSDLSPFQRVALTQTQAGNFDAATWLENQIHLRQTSLLQHATHVRLVCGEIEKGLYAVSEALETTDGDNSRALAHQVNVIRYDSYKDGEIAVEVAGTPGPGSQDETSTEDQD